MIDQIILGALQGVVEWLPFSSEAVLVLAQVHLLGRTEIVDLIETALFFHLGTFLAALVYFRKEIWRIIRALFSWQRQDTTTQAELRFYVVSTIISASLGYGILHLLESEVFDFAVAGKFITIGVGVMLLLTASLQLWYTMRSIKERYEITPMDGVWAGIGQGLAALPGVSRSGTTVAILLLRGVTKKAALQLSFIMSLPIVLGGNIVLNSHPGAVTSAEFAGLGAAFLVGLATIHGLMRLAKKINFGWFVFLFGLLTILAGLFFV